MDYLQHCSEMIIPWGSSFPCSRSPPIMSIQHCFFFFNYEKQNEMSISTHVKEVCVENCPVYCWYQGAAQPCCFLIATSVSSSPTFSSLLLLLPPPHSICSFPQFMSPFLGINFLFLTRLPLKVPSNPKHSMVLWYHNSPHPFCLNFLDIWETWQSTTDAPRCSL